jgi:hypothetical protein
MKRKLMKSAACGALLTLAAASTACAAPWKFGVMDDTQWTCSTDPAGANPNKVAVSFITQINQKFIDAGVKFVIQVGDLTENGADADIAVRAGAAQTLYNAGIGFYPMRGNHETYTSGNNFGMTAVQTNFPQTQCSGVNVFGVTNCSSPTTPTGISELAGLTYSFDYSNGDSSARFLVIDNWVTPTKNVAPGNGYNYGWSIAEQQPWISERLNKTTRGAQHAFVFSHQPLMAENHQDSPFQGYANANPSMQNDFFASLTTNNVKYYISGHDHIHQRSIIASPDGLSNVQEIIGASNSSKFYTPKALTDTNWKNQKGRETSLSQEMYTVGYYIYTIDGPRLTVDYYSDDHGNWASDNSFPGSGLPNQITPVFNFAKKESWGYSLNGKEILVAQGGSYALTDDTVKAVANGETGYLGTTAKILGGTNGSIKKDYNSRSLTKNVDTGWAPQASGTVSDILYIWGMTDLSATSTDKFALSMTYDPSVTVDSAFLNAGHSVILNTKDASGNWVNAVDQNVGGRKRFILGPYNAAYPLGTYGIDPAGHTAWAVINTANSGQFAVVQK